MQRFLVGLDEVGQAVVRVVDGLGWGADRDGGGNDAGRRRRCPAAAAEVTARRSSAPTRLVAGRAAFPGAPWLTGR